MAASGDRSQAASERLVGRSPNGHPASIFIVAAIFASFLSFASFASFVSHLCCKDQFIADAIDKPRKWMKP